MRHACVAQPAAGPAHFVSRPRLIQISFNSFSVKLLSDALLEIKYLQIYWASFSEFHIIGKPVKLSI
jgi:hypothetical protein